MKLLTLLQETPLGRSTHSFMSGAFLTCKSDRTPRLLSAILSDDGTIIGASPSSYINHSLYFLVARPLPVFFRLASLSTSPGWQLSNRQIRSRVEKLIPTDLPFFNRHSVEWLMPVSFASQ
jgi:hypothetical protein